MKTLYIPTHDYDLARLQAQGAARNHATLAYVVSQHRKYLVCLLHDFVPDNSARGDNRPLIEQVCHPHGPREVTNGQA